MSEYRPFYRRNLPHYQPRNATLFVTFRLHGSLPIEVIERLRLEHEENLHGIESIADPIERDIQRYDEHKRYFGKFDHALDSAQNAPHWLAQPAIGDMLHASILYRDGHQYDLHASTILSNHAHIVFTPLLQTADEPYPLEDIMQSLKGYTAFKANRLLKRSGAFWQAESYDHVVRDAGELERIIGYVLNNPVKAGCVADWQAWKWSYVK